MVNASLIASGSGAPAPPPQVQEAAPAARAARAGKLTAPHHGQLMSCWGRGRGALAVMSQGHIQRGVKCMENRRKRKNRNIIRKKSMIDACRSQEEIGPVQKGAVALISAGWLQTKIPIRPPMRNIRGGQEEVESCPGREGITRRCAKVRNRRQRRHQERLTVRFGRGCRPLWPQRSLQRQR